MATLAHHRHYGTAAACCATETGAAGRAGLAAARIAAAPDLAELHGVVVGYGAVWRFLARQGLTFNQKPARRRAAWA
jgi:transposase